jgi:hypothetical protein
MTNLTRSQFQAHPFHLVSPSLWPLNTSFCLLATTFSAVLSFQGFEKGVNLLFISLISVIYSMSLWFRDVISEGINLNSLKSLLSNYNSSRVISNQEILNILKTSEYNPNIKEDQLGYYLAGLLEGDGHLSLPFLGKTILNRVLNPRIVFTSHVNDIVLYAYIQSKLGGIGRFQLIGNNKIRYIIGDIKGIVTIIDLIKNKLRTPKNYSLNKLIEFINNKYKLNISESFIDKSDLSTNSWFSGFTEADGHFGVVITKFKPKSLSRKRSSSARVNLKFVINQRLHDEVTSLSLLSIMQEIAKFLSCNLNSYFTKQNKEFLCVNISGIEKLKFIINYFNKYPLAGIKNENFKDWVKIYDIIISNQHTTVLGRANIKLIQSNMNSKRQLKPHLTTNMLKSELSYLYIIILAFIIYGINELDFNYMYINNYIHMVKDSGNAVVEMNNIKINGIETALDNMRDGAIYIGGMSVAGKVIKNCSLPITAKLGATIGMGTAALISYRMVQNNMTPYRPMAKLDIKVDKINANISPNKKSLLPENISKQDNSNNLEDNMHNISELDLEQLKLDYYLQLVILYLLLIILVFLIMKAISEKDLKLDYLKKLPWANYIEPLLIKILDIWKKTNIIWIYILLVTIIICLIISIWSIGIILKNII